MRLTKNYNSKFMSTLWQMIVMKKKDDYIDLLVKFDHPDAGPFPQDKNFALQLLISEAYDYEKNFGKKIWWEYVLCSTFGWVGGYVYIDRFYSII